MKKLLILLLIFSGCSKQIYDAQLPQKVDRGITLTLADVNLGTAPNSGNGDPIRTAFGKGNSNNALIEGAFATTPTETQMHTAINDSLLALRTDALLANDYVFLKPDSNEYGGAITRTWLETYGGGGGSTAADEDYLEFIIGTTTGAPANGDTTFTLASLAGRSIELGRGTTADLHPQWRNTGTANIRTGYCVYSTAAGTIRVRPAFATGDRFKIRSIPSTNVSYLTFAGGGSTLLTGLLGWWDLNETGGSIAVDATGTYTGQHYNSPTLSATGVDYDGTNDYTSMGTTAGLRPTGDFSIFIKINTTQATYGTMVSNYISYGGNHYGFHIGLTDAGVIEAVVCYGTATVNQILSTTAIDNGADHTVIFTYTSATDVTNIYIDNGASEDTDNTAGTVTYYTTNQFHIGDRGEGDIPFDGIVRKCGIWSKILSAGEKTTLQTNSFPFN